MNHVQSAAEQSAAGAPDFEVVTTRQCLVDAIHEAVASCFADSRIRASASRNNRFPFSDWSASARKSSRVRLAFRRYRVCGAQHGETKSARITHSEPVAWLSFHAPMRRASGRLSFCSGEFQALGQERLAAATITAHVESACAQSASRNRGVMRRPVGRGARCLCGCSVTV